MSHCNYCAMGVIDPCENLGEASGCLNMGNDIPVTRKSTSVLPPANPPTEADITRDVIEAIPELDRRDPGDVAKSVCHSFNTPRSKLLDEVMEIVHKDRNANYGSPENNFQQIADLWNAYLRAVELNRGNVYMVKISPADVAIMNMLIKVARLAKNPNHHDSAVDIAGYAACLADVQSAASSASK